MSYTSIEVSGVGVHTGRKASVILSRSANPVISITCQNNYKAHVLGQSILPQFSASRCTIASWDGRKLIAPEHVLAVLVPFARYGIHVEVLGVEFPALDGSSRPWLSAIHQLLQQTHTENNEQFTETLVPTYELFDVPTSINTSLVSGFAAVQKSHRFEIEVSLPSHPNAPIHRWGYPAEPSRDTITWEQLVDARTFISWKEWQKGREFGLLRGVRPKCGLGYVDGKSEWEEAQSWLGSLDLSHYPYFWGGAPRFSGELAAHKILDLLGDLAWLGGRLPKISLQSLGAGHHHHLQLLENLNS